MNNLARPRIAAVEMNPDASQLPGGQVLQNIINGVGGWAIALALLALVVSAAIWALGSNSQNYQYTVVGKRGVVVSAIAALLIGAAPAVINFFYSAGGTV